MKIQFNHNANSLSDSLNMSVERIKEIRDSVYDQVSDSNSYNCKSELLEHIINTLNLVKPEEIFILGTIFGVLDYMNKENHENEDKYQEYLKDAAANMEKGVSPVLKLDKFAKEMRDGEEEF